MNAEIPNPAVGLIPVILLTGGDQDDSGDYQKSDNSIRHIQTIHAGLVP